MTGMQTYATTLKYHGVGGRLERDQWLNALVALKENRGLVSSRHMMANDNLTPVTEDLTPGL